VDHFFRFANAERAEEAGPDGSPVSLQLSPEQYNVPVEDLSLSSRTLNCLKRASLDKVGQILEMKKADLLQIKNFGEKSLSELYERLRANDLLPADLDLDLDPDIEVEPEEEAGEVAEVAAVSSEAGATVDEL
jgi:DNA-directed RNA polymerase subunit alpha